MSQKNKKSDLEDDDEEDMYVQLKEIKNEKSPKKKKNKQKQKKKRNSDSDQEEDDDDDDINFGALDLGKQSISKLQDIKDVNGFTIKQLWSPCEIFTGCQTENHYYVYPSDSSDEVITEESVPMLKSIEKSNCCIRNLLSGRCRPFEMTINTHIKDGDSSFNENVILFLKREFKCTFYCWQRPVIEVFQVKKGTHELVGRVTNPFFCARLDVVVTDKHDKLLFSIDSSCFKCAFLCQNFGCESCQEMEFNVTDYDGNDFTTIKKKNTGCCVSCISDTSQYFINFPKGTDNSEKLLLLAASILIDYMYFEGGSKICLNI